VATSAQSEPTESDAGATPQSRSRGPRIAQVRMLKPENT